MKITLYRLRDSSDIEKVWDQLEGLGQSLLYSDSQDNLQLIYGNAISKKAEKAILKQISEIQSIEETVLPEIDWEAQWEAHGQGYKDGCLEVDMAVYSSQNDPTKTSLIKLVPGPGFGDLSHPTTRLVMRLMSDRVAGKSVLDIGCGSGVLSLAAVAMGALEAFGIDIDALAVEHSLRNAEMNEMNKKVHFMLPDEARSSIPRKPMVALMNMIHSEQMEAWESGSYWHSDIDLMITSGILLEGKEDYLSLCRRWGYERVEEKEEEGWLGFILKRKTDS